jgi:biofilm PGA synthesis N-glycosyltransferase PgaC
MTRPTCAVGVMAYDEEFTIGEVLRAILDQRVESADVTAVVVVASGCRDGTERIVRDIAAREPRLHLLTEPERRGKISADNLFLARFPADLYVLCNADVLPAPGAFELLLAPLRDPSVGIVGGRVHPRVRTGRRRGFFDFANHLLWEIHHRVAIDRPKMGEAVAFRPFVDRIPEAVIADEAYLEAMARARQLRVVYAMEAKVTVGAPLALVDYFQVRRRNTCAHELLHRQLRYPVATLSAGPIVRTLATMAGERLRRTRGLAEVMDLPQVAMWTVGTVALEVAARLTGKMDARLAPDRHRRWHMARSARRPRPPVSTDTRATSLLRTG